MERTILLVDMDAFFASVEQRDHPELKGKPVVVGADPKGGFGRGVVATASYEARAFGIHSGQPISQAFRLCPHAHFLPVRIHRYAEVSARIMHILEQYTPFVEPVSLDEAFLDLTGTERLWGNKEKVAREIKEKIRVQEQLPASIGIGPNKCIAKMACDYGKPDGLVVINKKQVQDFLDPLPVRKLYGVGENIARELERMELNTIGRLRQFPKTHLMGVFGVMGALLWERANGRDPSPVIPYREAKSVSHETTFDTDVSDPQSIQETVLALAEKVGFRVRQMGAIGHVVTLKIRFYDFQTHIRHRRLKEGTDLTEVIYRTACELLREFASDPRPIRLIGIGLSGLWHRNECQLNLFTEKEYLKRKRAHEAVDKLKRKYGEDILFRGKPLS